MQRRIKECGTSVKAFIFIVLAIFSTNVFAEYYLVYPGPHVVCQTACGERIYVKKKVKKVKKIRKHYVKRHRIHKRYWCRRCVPCRSYVTVYRPCRPAVRACGTCMVRPRCATCYPGGYVSYSVGHYAEPVDYTNIYPDQATGDDDPMYDPELNIDR